METKAAFEVYRNSTKCRADAAPRGNRGVIRPQFSPAVQENISPTTCRFQNATVARFLPNGKCPRHFFARVPKWHARSLQRQWETGTHRETTSTFSRPALFSASLR